MNLLKYRIKKSTCLQLSFLFTFLVSPVSLFAFSDMNDSTAQVDIVKSLQKRIDSLELRFEKSEIEKNEAKKSVFDWNRGLYANVSFKLTNFSLGYTSLGYMIKKIKHDKAQLILCPQIRLGTMDLYGWSGNGVDFFTSFGLEKIKRVAEHVSYTDGWFLNLIPNFVGHSSPLAGIGGEYSNSVNFYYNENSSLGIGSYFRLNSLAPDHRSWKSALKNSTGFGVGVDAGLRLIYTAGFARHEAKQRSK